MKIFKVAFIALCLGTLTANAATDCEMFIQVVPPDGNSGDLPMELSDLVTNRLVRALTQDGTVASPDYGQLYITARCADLYKETLAGPPVQTAVRTELTLAVADIIGGTVFATRTFELRGVGTSEQRAYINALQSINATKLEKFVSEAKTKTIAYFDKHYSTFLSKAARAASLHNYDEALYYSTLIPECSTGYAQAEAATQKYFQAYIDEDGYRLLNEAKAAFAVSPNAEGATKAYSLINRISPQSAAYPAAMAFAEQVGAQTKIEYDFEVHQKYEDAVDVTRRRIDAARQVGIAFGQGQKSTTTNILWK